jgi:hypothetical protein
MIGKGTKTASGIGDVSLLVRGRGNIRIETTGDGITLSELIKDSLYVPNFSTNLFSIGNRHCKWY